MKKNYMEQGNRSVALFFLLILTLGTLPMHAQTQQAQQGILRIKVSESLSEKLEATSMRKSSAGLLVTGVSSMDLMNEQYLVRGLKRVFRNGGAFEEKHRKYGLHLWYEISLDESIPIIEAISGFSAIDEIEISEPVLPKMIIGSDADHYGSRPYVPEEYQSGMASLSEKPDDPFVDAQWHYDNIGQTGGTVGADISLFKALELETGDSEVIVAVTDGGIQVDHPDLEANMWINTGEVPGNGIDDDGNGYVDDIHGYGFGDGTGQIAPDPHGTHVGGTVAAVTNNGIGVAGVAGGSGAGDGVRLISCAAFGATNNGGFAEAYVYAADMGAVISQNSWGYRFEGSFERSTLDAIDYFIAEAGKDPLGNQTGPMSGGIVIFAAGNSNSDGEWYPGYYSPTLTVAALNHNDQRAYYSNYGEWVDIAAPGGELNVANEQGVLSTLTNDQYGFIDGTSMACPHVSGLAALIISRFGGAGFNPAILRDQLTNTVDEIDSPNPGYEGLLGFGRINAFSALQSEDGEGPLPVTDLTVADVEITSVLLSWTAPLDSGNGSASFYDIRYATTPIDSSSFDSALPLGQVPTPAGAGSLDSVRVRGLAPGTTYYFALKSRDFFNNESLISNVISQTTNEAPNLVPTDSILVANLLTAQTTVEYLKIINKGMGPLELWIQPSDSAAFVTVSPATAHIAAGDSLDLAVTFDASGLFGGVYQGSFDILSNDLNNPVFTVYLTLHVTNNGAPIAKFTPADTLDFGGLFVGASSSLPLFISNEGTDSLEVLPPTIGHASFSSNLSGQVMVAPFDSLLVLVDFAPTTLGPIHTTMVIPTSDALNSNYQLALTGEGLLAPDVAVSPDSLFESLFFDQTSVQNLTISNTGDSDLTFSLTSTGTSPLQTSGSQIVEFPQGGMVLSSGSGVDKMVSTNRGKEPSAMEVNWSSQSASPISVLILTPDADLSFTEALLEGFPDVLVDVFGLAGLPALTVSDLLPYDIVFTTNNGQWLATGGVDPVVVGDVLADYVDAGGKVIANSFAYSYDEWQMSGRFIEEDYGPFLPATTDANISTSLGGILASDHPVIQGVATLEYTGYVQDVGLSLSATAIALWDNGELLVAANDDVVALNLLPDYGDGSGFTWTGNLAVLYHNAIHYLMGTSFLSFSPFEGSVSPGQSAVIDLSFDASGLGTGQYQTSIEITANVPGSELVEVPATLSVVGPEIEVLPERLSEVLEKEQTSTQTLRIVNNGLETYPIDVFVATGEPLSGTVDSSSASKAADQHQTKISNKGVRVSLSTRGKPVSGSSNLLGLEVSSEGLKRTLSTNSLLSATVRVLEQSSVVYETGFEEFAIGDIDDQNGWLAQYGNWTVESLNPATGSQHFQGLSDGLGLTQALSPYVGVGIDSVSALRMKVNLTGLGTTWQLIPNSFTSGLIVTRLQFNPDGTASVLVPDSLGDPYFEPIAASVPSGYFNLAIESVRATGVFTISFNGVEVYSGQGFAGDIEELYLLSLMEVPGPTLDIDDLAFFDGPLLPDFVSVFPLSDSIGPGQTVDLTVTFDSEGLEFGQYSTDILLGIGGEEFVVPASLQVVGDPVILIDLPILQAEVPYKGDTTQVLQMTNTGGNPLTYGIQVLGADTDLAGLSSGPVKQTDWKADQKTLTKMAKEMASGKLGSELQSPQVIQLMTGDELFSENFEGGTFPPDDWELIDNEGTGVVWAFAADYGEGNYTGTGEVATVSSDAAGVIDYDTELITPLISTEGYKNVMVQYHANFQNISSDVLEVDIQLEGASTWTNVLSWNEDHGLLFSGPGEQVILELDDYLHGATAFRLKWHYYNPGIDDWDWYAQIDDLVVLGDPRRWLSITPATGTVAVGQTESLQVTFDAEDIDEGFYNGGVIITSNAVNAPLIGLPAFLTVLGPPELSVSVDSLYEYLFVGETTTQTFSVSNSGASPLNFSLDGSDVSLSKTSRIAPKSIRTTPTQTKLNLADKKVIRSNGIHKSSGVAVYGTGFEEFITGDIDGQNGWYGEWGNWTVEGTNSFEGGQHFRGLSDGLGLSAAFSPEVSIGSEPISSFSLMMSMEGAGSTWQIVPLSATAELVNTRLMINPDLSLEILVADSLDEPYFEPIEASLPEDYFELRMDVDRATSIFTVYFDAVPVYTGQGFAGDIEQVAVISPMEVFGPTLDIDNLSIWDGAPGTPWFALSPLTGTVSTGGSQEVTVFFDAYDLEKGLYTDVISLNSNDPDRPLVDIPITLEVDQNFPPVLEMIADTSVVERGSLDLTFLATDLDDSVLTVRVDGLPPFMSLTSSSRGAATYAVEPKIGDAGAYTLLVIAEDGRGALDSASFVLTVAPYGIVDFTLINSKNGQVITNFSDSVEINVHDPDFLYYLIQANTNPGRVGSVKFDLNGRHMNTDVKAPYQLHPLLWMGVSGGSHTVLATPYTRKWGRGQQGLAKTAVFTLVNPTSVSALLLVNKRGKELGMLTDSLVIDLSDPDFDHFNVIAELDGPTRQVYFEVNGRVRNVDHEAPYSLAGGRRGAFQKWWVSPGTYTVKVTPVSGWQPQVMGVPLSVTFQVIDGSSNALLRDGVGSVEALMEPALSVYPVPTNDEVEISLAGITHNQVEVYLINLQGKIVYQTVGTPGELHGKKLSLRDMELQGGVYVLKVKAGEISLTREIIKR